MSNQPEQPGARTGGRAARKRSPDLLTDTEVEDRADVEADVEADIEEDRRRQREFDDAEMGGEA